MYRMRVSYGCAFVAGLLLFACSKNKDDAGKATDKPAKPVDAAVAKPLGPSPFPELKMAINGKPVPVHSIHAYWVGKDAVKIEVSSVKRGCNLHPRMRTVAPGEHYFKVWFGKRLDTKGQASWAVIQSFFAGGTNRDHNDKRVTFTSTPTARVGAALEGTLELTQQGHRRRNRPGQKLTISGPFKAINCKVPIESGFSSRPGDLGITVGSAKARLLGATVRRVGKNTRIVLSTDPRSCKRSAGLSRAVIKLMLNDGVLKRAVVSGTWFPTRMSQDIPAGKPPLTIKLSPTADLELTGTLTLDGYPITLTGKTTAISCK